MREIRFRGKEHTGEWITGGYVQKNGAPHIVAHIVDRGVDEWRAIPVIPATVGQYTGLKDAKGVEIYEGDIVCIWSGSTGVVRIGTYNNDFLEYSPTICGVYCNEIGGANHNFGLTQYFTNEVEVVGNVHDAPELLGGESPC